MSQAVLKAGMIIWLDPCARKAVVSCDEDDMIYYGLLPLWPGAPGKDWRIGQTVEFDLDPANGGRRFRGLAPTDWGNVIRMRG